MIADSKRTIAVSSLGWVDHGALWVYRHDGETIDSAPLSDAKYLSLHAGRNDCFAVVHHYEKERVEVTAHRFSRLDEPEGRVVVAGNEAHFAGETRVWREVAHHYVAYVRGPLWSDFALIALYPDEDRIELQTFEWYGDQYDKGYQGIVGVTEVPGSPLVIVSVQRDSRPILYDPVSRLKRGEITLASRGGNPTLCFREGANELWADDYDTVLKLDGTTFSLLASRRLQGSPAGTAQFIGGFSFDASRALCLVARPFSGDVVAIDSRTLKTRYRCRTGAQPLEATMFGDDLVVARDWKTGAILKGRMRRTWSFGWS